MTYSPLEAALAKSSRFEMLTYLDSTEAMYSNSLLENIKIYDIAFENTRGFRNITDAAILQDSRIIKTLRYAIAPTISQMKLGQFFDLRSTNVFESSRAISGTSGYGRLEAIALKLAEFLASRIDGARFKWLDDPSLDSDQAREYAKMWTCSLAADQNAQTDYRTWRKKQQEQAVTSHLVSLGYTRSSFRGTIHEATDLSLGEYVPETKVRGRTTQKADLAFRSRSSSRLVLVEAKVVGVLLDATKRTKECCDKASDWHSSAQLSDPLVVAVIAGFFSQSNIESLLASNVIPCWEHQLEALDGL